MNLRLKELRMENKLLQRQVAEHLHCTQQTYCRYERGDLIPSLQVLALLAMFYDTSVDYIIGITDQRSPHKRGIRRFHGI